MEYLILFKKNIIINIKLVESINKKPDLMKRKSRDPNILIQNNDIYRADENEKPTI
jgi:hypothetical protein